MRKNLAKFISGAGIFLLGFAPFKNGFSQINYRVLKANISTDISRGGKIIRFWDCISFDSYIETKRIYINFKAANNSFTLNDYANLSLGGKVVKDKPWGISPQVSAILEPKLVQMPDSIPGSIYEYGKFAFMPEFCAGIRGDYRAGKFSGSVEANIPFNFDSPIYYIQHNLKTKIGTFGIFAKGRSISESYSELNWTGKAIKNILSPFVKYSFRKLPEVLPVKNMQTFEVGISLGAERSGKEDDLETLWNE